MNTTDNISKYIELLETNKNLILTGAPGTGKTYIAKAIAEEMGAEVGFVQFHPSYDYTDFVEGLRPIKECGDVGFELFNGVFKEFCRKALMDNNDTNEIKQKRSQPKASTEFEDIYMSIVNDIKSGKINKYNTAYKTQLLNVKDNRIIFRAGSEHPRTEKEENIKLMYNYLVSNNIFDISQYGKDDFWGLISKLTGDKTKTIDYMEYSWILQELLKRTSTNRTESQSYKPIINHPDVILTDETKAFLSGNKSENNKYVFIIDEINRGEISKIFGELFFSIDPGYRGEKGRVQTQYQNMIENDDVFKDGFYVPENVYIIGTMNDIDRSVESMDFAMRRRFAWQEVTAEESYYNMIENAEDKEEYTSFKDEIKQRMFNLNKAIAETEGLNEAYQIGAAYFRKVLDYINEEQPFECLWNNHLKGLLFEYLRGNRKAKELLEKLYKAYNMTVADE